MIAALCLAILGTPEQGPAGLEFERGDRIVLIGGALAERMQHHGWLEARLQVAAPGLELSVRNLGFSGDELAVAQRTAGFGSREEWFERARADVVFAFFGFNESFRGEGGIADFERDLRELAASVGERRLVLFGPVGFEDPAPDRAPELARYTTALERVAGQLGVPYVPLAESLRSQGEDLTIDGIHLNERGNSALADVIVAALFPDAPVPDPARLEAVRALVLEKNLLWFNRYRATDGYNVYGGRSSLEYDGVTNFVVLQRELEVLDALCDELDESIQAVARGSERPPAPVIGENGVPELLAVETNRPGEGPGGTHVYRSATDALAAMTPAAGMRVEVFADESSFPELVNPVQMTFDPAGRLWVAVWPTYPHWRPGDEMDDRLLVLSDTDGDGKADRCETFAGGLHNPTGFELWGGGVFVANPPDLLFLRDTDGDGRADTRERVLHGLSSADTHHAANSFVLGPDGALYFQEGTFHQSQIETPYGPVRSRNACVWRFEPRTWRVERYVAYDFANPHGHVFDRWGQDFITDGTGNENYYALPFSGHLDEPDKHSAYFTFFRQRSRPAAATEIVSSRHFPDANQGNYLVANVIGFQGIFQYELFDAGSGFGAHEVEPLLFSSDPNFRPVDLEIGPDGALYFLDWHNALIGHMQHHLRDPSRDEAHGRVYRVVSERRPLLDPAPIAGRSIPQLLELLKEPEDRVRYRARIELSARDPDDVADATLAWVARLDPGDPGHEHDLLEALWLGQQHGVLDQALLERLLRAEEPRARAAATRVLRGMRREAARPLELLRERALDPAPRVRLEAVVALSHFPSVAAAELALLVLRQETDRFLDYALEETLRALEPHWRGALATGESFAAENPPGLAHVLARIDAAALAQLDPERFAPNQAVVFAELLSRPGLERADYLRGLEGLAAARESSPAAELETAVKRIDEQGGGHADHLLIGLFDTVAALPSSEREAFAGALPALATTGKRDSTRRLATATRIELEGSVEAAWQEASRTLTGLADLLDALPLVADTSGAEARLPDVLALVDGAPPGLDAASASTRGRFVRIELPGAQRTLTLAEVEVRARGANIATRGTATQSSVRWNGYPERALDGNKSPNYEDQGQTHTVEDQPDPWWELDLGEELSIEEVEIWNRDEGDGTYSDRLNGLVLRVLDAERRTVFQERIGEAPRTSVRFDLTDPGLRVRRAAARAAGSLARTPDAARLAVPALVAAVDDAGLRPAALAALGDVPAELWPDEATVGLGEMLLALFTDAIETDFETARGRELLAFADELAPRLEAGLGMRLVDARRRLGPQVVVIRSVPESLRFDTAEFTVVTGHPVELVFDNVDLMPHNLLVTVPGALAKVGLAAERMAADPTAGDRGYRPDLSEVLEGTRLLFPGEQQVLRFDAPATPGDYPYVCTFPGHWVRMNGVMRVVTSFDDVAAPVAAAEPEPGASGKRGFVRDWQLADVAPRLDEVAVRDATRGRALFEEASCVRCHAIAGEGGTTGPELTEVVPRYTLEELAGHVFAPSEKIDPEYVSEIFVLLDGRVKAGRVVEEDEEVVVVQEDPYDRGEALELWKDELEERVVSDVSTMPSGLLSTFALEEVLDLLAYLESLRSE